MRTLFFSKFFSLLLILLLSNASALDMVSVNNNTGEVSLSSYSEIFFDKQDYFTYDDVTKELFNENFKPSDSNSLSLGYTSDSVWIRFGIKNNDNTPFHGKLEIPAPWIDSLNVYIQSDESLISKRLGSELAFKEREVDSKSFFMPLVIKPLSSITVYIKAEGSNAMTLSPYLYGEKKSYERLRHIATFNGVLIGMILIMLIYHLNRYRVLEDKNYLYFAMYLTSLLFYMGIFYGYNIQLFWKSSPFFNSGVSPVIIAFSFFSALLFSRNFLMSSNNFPKSERYLNILMYTFVLFGIFSIFIDNNMLINYIVVLLSIPYSIGLIYISMASMQKDISGSGYLLSGWLFFTISIILSIMITHGIIDYSNFMYDLYGYAVILNIILLSFAMVARSNDMRLLSDAILEKEHESLYKITKKKVELQGVNERLQNKINKQSEQISNIDKEYEKFSIKDKLTNLYNRAKLEELLANELHRSKRYLDDFSLIVVNIDNLSSINDTHSFQVGNSIIKEMADILIKHIRYIDTVGRWSENEYLIICPETDAEQAKIASEHIKTAIENYKFFFVGSVTASFGVTACLPTDSGQDIITRAYEALAKAKENGKNRIEVL